ncbi:MAG TPA: hypothetical protein VG672_19835 [Bryobacteraceae bacterium]|nr:hypothetical protein [Bryobacteraceae bacterium]
MHRPYRLVEQGGSALLIPPNVRSGAVIRRSFSMDGVAEAAACRTEGQGVEIRARNQRLRITVSRNWLQGRLPGWLSAWAAELETRGCVRPGAADSLAGRIAEALPLPPNAAFHLLHVNDRMTGQVDLGPQTRLQVVSPILREGAPPDAPLLTTKETKGNGQALTLTVESSRNLVGYETAWYAVKGGSGGGGLVIEPLFAERNIQGRSERRAGPAVDYFRFGPARGGSRGFYRLFYKAGETGFTALAIAASTRAELEDRTRLVETGAASCGKPGESWCTAIPKRVAVNPFVATTVNGREVLVAWGGTVSGALREAGVKDANAVLPRLAVSRWYAGRLVPVEFDPAKPAILSLILSGGETITWK